MAQSENSTPTADPGLSLYSTKPAAHGDFSRPVMSSTQCGSPAVTASVQGPFSRCRKRPPSPEYTTGSLSTFASAGKKACSTFSALSESKQPRTTLLNYFPYHKHGALPSHTALTSAVTEADDDDLDEAVSSFRAPPGHIPHPDDVPRHVRQSRQPFSNLPSLTHTNIMSPFSSSAGPLPCASSSLPLVAADTPVFSSSSMTGYTAAQHCSGPRCTSTSYMPSTGVLYKGAEPDRDDSEETNGRLVNLVISDHAEARHALGFRLRRRSLPSMSGQDTNVSFLQSAIMS